MNVARSSRFSAVQPRGRSRRARSSRRSYRPSVSWARARGRPLANGSLLLCSDCANSVGSRVAPSRSSIAGRRDATSASARSRPSSSGSRSISSSRREPHKSSRQSRRHQSSRSSSRPRGTRSPAALSPVWRDRAATLPACRVWWPILRASGSNFCVRLSPVSADWLSWATSAIPCPCWKCARFRRRPARSVSKSTHSKSGEPYMPNNPARCRGTALRRQNSAESVVPQEGMNP
jgi:hypothetical protein